MRFRKTAIAIIVNDNKILFIKRDNIPTIAEPDKWQLPGGHLEEGETPIKALKRELVEEVSYSPKKIHYIGSLKNKVREVSIFWSYVDKNEIERFKLGPLEGQEIKFMTVEDALNKRLTSNVKLYLSSYKDIIKKHLYDKTTPDIDELKQNTKFIRLLFLKLFNL
ncbi:MAG: hypothetical protein US39_C0005G0010 [Microgenomates group bacterium GW2011_GWC1_37_12b]|uniref:Nudix hydrolase domain-containing protein n=2 Tax=Candidatus Woeseibacteriota TaxID=1752722 RepID=A0A0G0L6I6_9BACT|nr:MAG: hypothetical protein US39_C0005G0010 [Microgenomates group bacterium GW2011_GWC1_37_12b]KKQ87623.1 MAG: hypothetical protein UT10_C0003G0027 [Candidatus Woesebacteria bacterium GW2011_GWB1_38_8b]